MGKIYIGIDPGKMGAVAIINDANIQLIDTPTTEIKVGKKKKNVYVESLMSDIFRGFQQKDSICVVLEKIHSMPGQGVASMFSMGEGYGIWRGILASFQLPYTLITPQAWKKAMLAGFGKEKSVSCYRAQQLFPLVELFTKRGRALDGRGDALLMAEYAKRCNF